MTIDEIDSLCSSLAGVTKDVKWEADLCFSVAKKMFCVIGIRETPYNVSFKVSDEEFDEISIRPGFEPAQYLARHKWVTVNDITKLTSREGETLIEGSYELVKAKLPKRTQENLLK